MKILQVIPDIKSESAGPTYYILSLCRCLAAAGEEVELHLLHSAVSANERFPIVEYAKRKFPHPSLGRSPEMYTALATACQHAEIIHNNSLWMMPNIYPGKAIKGTRCKQVISPHGTLAPWALERRKYLKKLTGILLGQYHALNQAAMFHATCHKEYQEIRAAGYTQPVAVIPIGIDLPAVGRIHPNRRKLLFLGRVHPVKAVDRLLQAWAIVAKDFPDWDFQIVGPDCGLGKILHEMAKSQQIPRVEFVGEQNSEGKFKYYAAADLYALPSFTENFGVSVAEALACGTPVIVSDTVPWKTVVEKRCGWIIQNSPEKLANQLRLALSYSRSELEQMGIYGQEWMRQDYSWSNTGAKMIAAYSWLLHGGSKPEFVIET